MCIDNIYELYIDTDKYKYNNYNASSFTEDMLHIDVPIQMRMYSHIYTQNELKQISCSQHALLLTVKG